MHHSAQAQFYRGSHQDFGKNRIQYDERVWSHMDFEKFNVYYYGTGVKHAEYTAKRADKHLRELERFFDYRLNSSVYILVFNNFRESNIGLEDGDDQNIGGKIRINGNKLFIYYQGDHSAFDKQIRKGMAEMLFYQMSYGENWKEVIKNSALLNIPDWYSQGLISYSSEHWDSETDDRIRDAVLGDRFKKFNRLEGDEARYLGHALWHYIGQIYGTNIIPNIVYMSRISRNIENGFLYVLGISMETLINDARAYYSNRYTNDDRIRMLPESDQLRFKTKKTRSYQRFTMSPDSKYLAYTSDEFSQKRIYLYNIEKERKKKLKRLGHKLDRISDKNYPVLAWHPSGEILAAAYEKKGQVYLHLYDVNTKKWEQKFFRNIEQVLSMSFSDDGKTIAVSAVRKGQVDLFAYKLLTSSIVQLTNDPFDDLEPHPMPGTDKWVFRSNRPNDTIKTDKEYNILDNIQPTYDIFVYDYGNKNDVLTRITNTPKVSEQQAYGNRDGSFIFLSDESGIMNRYIGIRDSTISRIDTTIHYRYFTNSKPVTNYKRNILEQYPEVNSEKIVNSIYYDGKYRLYLTPLNNLEALQNLPPVTDSSPVEGEKSKKNKGMPVYELSIEPKPEEDKPQDYVDINNYQFDSEEDKQEKRRKPIENSKFITLKVDKDKKAEEEEYKWPLKVNYRPAFLPTDVVTQLDWNFANSLYQRFNGGPYVNPGMGVVLKTSVVDLLEDLKFEGGIRYSFDGDNTEFFASFYNRKKRLDKQFMYQLLQQRQEINDFQLFKNIVQKGSIILKYPFSEVAAIRGTASLRQDRLVALAINNPSLETPDEVTYMGGIKFEFIFDNTRPKGLNLYNGIRYKFWIEGYQEFDVSQSDFMTIGMDYRHYTKVHRNIVWANRLTASTSLGSRKLVYYMGSVDDQIQIGGDPQFDFSQNIDRSQGYYFQTIATPMRGFIQNARNGNSFGLFNSELRWPIISYFSPKPLKNDFLKNFQVVGFTDVGTAWTGLSPYSEDNSFNTRTITSGGGSVVVELENKKDPIIGAYGAGLRSKLFGYFIRVDHAWGVEDGIIQDPVWHLSLALDF